MGNDNSPRDLRTLWQDQNTVLLAMSAEELHRVANKFTRKMFWRNAREYLAAVVVLVGYGYYIYRFHNVLVRLGSVLIMAAALWVSYRLHSRGAPRTLTPGMDVQSGVEFHRSELIRQRDLLSSAWKWYLTPFGLGLTVFLAGLLQTALSRPEAKMHDGGILTGYGVVFGVCAGAFVFIGKLNERGARKLQKQIDELDAMKGSSG